MARQRDEERLETLARVSGGVTTLIGPPGVGKSWLAQRLAAGSRGVVCALDDARTEDEMLGALAAALGATGRPQDDVRGLFLDWLLECTRDRTLVVLDDVDGVLGPVAELVRRWTTAGVAASLVVTAREPLRIAEERRLAIAPLAPGEAAALFLARARAVYGPDAVAEADLALLPEVVEALDGLPLAIELAVSRLDAVDLRALHGSLAEHRTGALDLLRSGFRATEPRHASLRAAFADATSALDPLSLRLLVSATCFRGGFSHEDLLEAALPDVSQDARREAFATLRRRSVVHATADGRFRLLNVVRELASEGQDALMPLAHAAHFARLARAEEPANVLAPPARLRAERDNLLAAYRVAVRERPDLVPDLVRGLHSLLAVRGPRSLHYEVIAAALDAAEAAGETEAAHMLLRRAEATLHWDGLSAQAVDDLERATAALRAAADGAGLTRALLARARQLLGAGEFDAFTPIADEALATARATKDPSLVARALRVHARRWLHDDTVRSEALLREALRLVSEQAAPATRAEVVAELSRAELNAGDCEAAAGHAAEALALHERLDSPHEATIARLDLAMPLWELGRVDEARRLLAQSAEDARAQRAARLEAFVVGYVGVCEAASGELELALHALPLAVARLEEHGDTRHARMFRAWWAAAAAVVGDAAAARAAAAPLRDVPGPLHHERSTELLLAIVDGGRPPDSTAPRTFEVRLAEKLVARAAPLGTAAPLDAPRTEAPAIAPVSGSASLDVQREGFFYVLPDGTRIDLDKRPILRRVLVSIARRAAEGDRASLEEVIADGWPGEKMRPDAAAHRAYMAISTLRRLGLRDLLRSVGDGYELVGGVRFVDPR